jgi:polyketide biosynthesis enoyl-CoA hydratase PksI
MNETPVIFLKVENDIATVSMEEREHKNTFTERFMTGMLETFDRIEKEENVKVVVLCGYDNYFCCGGTKDELLQLHEGMGKEGEDRIQFTDGKFHDILLRCSVPVVAAMQGHALGAGLALGCTADFTVMAEQCIYSTNFMKYGFTPGMGATCIVPEKLGNVLGNEMLFRATNYYGRDLKERGAPVPIVPRERVLPVAYALAADLAQKPCIALQKLKENQNLDLMRRFQDAVERELEMHRVTFTQPEVRQRIEALFGN